MQSSTSSLQRLSIEHGLPEQFVPYLSAACPGGGKEDEEQQAGLCFRVKTQFSLLPSIICLAGEREKRALDFWDPLTSH